VEEEEGRGNEITICYLILRIQLGKEQKTGRDRERERETNKGSDKEYTIFLILPSSSGNLSII